MRTIRILLLVLIVAAVLFLLFGCDSGREEFKNPVQAGEVYHVPSFQWHVVDQATLEDMRGYVATPGEELRGFMQVSPHGKYMVVTLPPKHIDDENVLTLGHEVLHVILNDYHE